MSNKIYKLMDLLDISDDYLNRRGINYDMPNEVIAPQGAIEIEEEFALRKNEEIELPKCSEFSVKPFRDNSGDSVPAPNPFLMPIPYALYVVGLVKAGKTTLLNSLLNIYAKCFDNIIVMSPTATIDPEMREIVEKFDIKNIYDNLSMISKIINEARAVNKNKRPKDKIKTLIIFDDMINKIISASRRDNHPINDLILNRRHMGVSVIVLSQYWKRVNPMWRNNFSAYCIFRMDNLKEKKKIIEELSGFLGFKRFEELFNEATRAPFSFLSINYDASDPKYQFTQNFNKIILKDSDMKNDVKVFN